MEYKLAAHVGKVMVVRIPPAQGFLGRAVESVESAQGAPPKGFWFFAEQRWQIPRGTPLGERRVASPASIRKP